MKQKIYRTKRLELRELRLSDWKRWREAQERSLPKQNEWDREAPPEERRTKARFSRTLLAQRKRFKKSEVYLWSIFLRDTGEFVGWIDVSAISRDRYQMANLGWFVMNTHRGLGIAKEAAMKIIRAAFSDLGFHRLEASIDPRNKASIRTARSIGLHREGVKKFYLNDGNDWQDAVAFVTTPELFYERQA